MKTTKIHILRNCVIYFVGIFWNIDIILSSNFFIKTKKEKGIELKKLIIIMV